MALLLTFLLTALGDSADLVALQPGPIIELNRCEPGKLDHLALDAKRDRLLVANRGNNTLDIVDLKEKKPLESIPNQHAIQGIAFAPDLDRVFVGLGTGGYCNIYRGQDYQLLNTLKFAGHVNNILYNPKRNTLYVSHAESSLGVLDARTLELKADIKLPGSAEALQCETDRSRLYLTTPSPSQVVVIDTDRNEITNTYTVKLAGKNCALGLDEANHRLFLGCRQKPAIVVMDTESGAEITSVDIPKDVNDLFFDVKRKRLYASCGEGFLAVIQQIDADHYKALEPIATAKGAWTCLFDPDSDRLFLAVPRDERKKHPTIYVYQAKP